MISAYWSSLRNDQMLRYAQGLLQNCRGATAVEFAFVAPLMLTLVFGIVSYGSIISVNNGLQQIVAEAARARRRRNDE